MSKLKIHFGVSFGAPLAVFLWLLSIYWDTWSKLDFWGSIALTVALTLIFFAEFSYKKEVS